MLSAALQFLIGMIACAPGRQSAPKPVVNRRANLYALDMSLLLKLVTTGVLGGWMLMTVGCEDNACKADLAMSKKELADQHKECSGQQTTIKELKELLADAQGKVETLTRENDALKAKSTEPQAKGPAKPAKAKHKKKRGRR